jgi:hypothetical protein
MNFNTEEIGAHGFHDSNKKKYEEENEEWINDKFILSMKIIEKTVPLHPPPQPKMITNALFQDKDVRNLIFKYKKNILNNAKFNKIRKNIGLKLLKSQYYTGRKNPIQSNTEIHNNSLLLAHESNWRDTAVILGLYYLLI